MSSLPPVWLRGPLPDIPPQLQGIAHGLLEALEEVKQALLQLPPAELWTKPSGAASVGFHLRHITGATDRLFTYARGESLTEQQKQALLAEQRTDSDNVSVNELLANLERTIESAMEQLRSTSVDTLDEPRFVGKKQLPSTVRGLLEHAAQHASRHSGQIVTTVKILSNSSSL
jgi:uncharacterized damage-inducible protein DinB